MIGRFQVICNLSCSPWPQYQISMFFFLWVTFVSYCRAAGVRHPLTQVSWKPPFGSGRNFMESKLPVHYSPRDHFPLFPNFQIVNFL